LAVPAMRRAKPATRAARTNLIVKSLLFTNRTKLGAAPGDRESTEDHAVA